MNPSPPHLRRPPRPVEPILDVIPVVVQSAAPKPIADAILVAPLAAPRAAGPILDVVPVAEAIAVLEPATRPGRLRRGWDGLWSAVEWLFGVASLIGGLAILAAIPVVQFLTLGYLLEVGGRVARTGRLRDGFVGVRKAGRVGSIVLGTALLLIPLYVLSAYTVAAQLIDPDGPTALRYERGLTLLTVFMVLHIVGAWSRGGRLHHFLWPSGNPLVLASRFWNGERLDVLGLLFFGNFYWLAKRLWQGGYYSAARDTVWDFVMGLRLPHYFWLGAKGFVASLAVLVVPVSLIALGQKVPVFGFFGALLLIAALLYVPFLQIRLARENSFLEGFNLRAIRADFHRAPRAFAFAFFLTMLLSLPLYLFKVEMIPRDGAWLVTPFFIVSIWPTRLVTGWAYGRARLWDQPRHWFFRLLDLAFLPRFLPTFVVKVVQFGVRWTCRLLILVVAAAYVFFTYFSQFTSWYGVWSLYEQHTFLLPVPFFEF